MKKLYQIAYDPGINSMFLGTYTMLDVMNSLRQSGRVSQYELEPIYDEIKEQVLNAEQSKSYNFSLIWESPNRKVRAEVSVFHHDIKNLINRVLIGCFTPNLPLGLVMAIAFEFPRMVCLE